MKPRPDPNKKWSPQEILDIPMPRDRDYRVNSRSACATAVAEAKILRDRIRRAKIIGFLEANKNATISQIIHSFKPEAIGIRSVWGWLKVLEKEGIAKCNGNAWNLTKGVQDETQ
jgi:hypothetical protein